MMLLRSKHNFMNVTLRGERLFFYPQYMHMVRKMHMIRKSNASRISPVKDFNVFVFQSSYLEIFVFYICLKQAADSRTYRTAP